MVQFLLVRRDDLVHVGLEFSDFELFQTAAADGSRPLLVAATYSSTITLTFPPQALCEGAVSPNDLFLRLTGTRAGTSRVQFAVPLNTAFELTAKGILAALQGPGVKVVPSEIGAVAAPTAIEIPWKLILSPASRDVGGSVVSRHAVMPATSDAGVTALWLARLQGSGATATDAGLVVVPLRSIPGDPEYFYPPLTEWMRNQIVAQGLPPPNARRFELSAIGVSLSVAAKWPTFGWGQDVILGRDDKMRVIVSGVLYPFGHRAVLTIVTARQFVLPQPSPTPQHPPQNGNGGGNGHGGTRPTKPLPQIAMAGLVTTTSLTIVEPVRTFAHDTALGRQFPFDEVEILEGTFAVQSGAGPLFVVFPPAPAGMPLLFPVRAGGRNGDVVMHVPMLFVNDASFDDPGQVRDTWNTIPMLMPGADAAVPGVAIPLPGVAIPLPGVAINMFAGSARANDPRDLHEVQALVIDLDDEAGAPLISGFTAELPALRALLAKPSVSTVLSYTQDYIDQGDAADLALEILDPIGIDFTSRADRSGGLIAPNYAARAISRLLGPVPGAVPLDQAFSDATLLGLPLVHIVDLSGLAPPTVVPLPGNPPGAAMTWKLRLKPLGPFKPATGSTATLNVKIAAAPPSGPPPGAAGTPASQTVCRVENFDFVLPPDKPLVRLHFDALTFTQLPGRHPDLAIDHVTVAFDGALQLINDLIKQVQQFIGANGPTIRALPSGISARYALAIPSVGTAAFVLKNVAASLAIDVPFSAGTVAVSIGFASRDNPFNLSVLALGGGGYIDVAFGGTGLSRFEASMDFGATLAVDFLVVKAEVHALGGVHFVETDTITVDAFLRIGGSVNVLGLVSVSIEMVILLSYDDGDNSLTGRATIVVDVNILFIHKSVTLDSGEWVLSGPAVHHVAHAAPPDAGRSLAGLIQYFQAFAPESTSGAR